VIRYSPCQRCCNVEDCEDVDGTHVRYADAQAEIGKRDQTIADLKALLYRAADAIDASGPMSVSPALAALGTEIEKALK
jgi:hypothetical protein